MSPSDTMVWYKAWTDTRRYFRLGAMILIAMVLGMYMSYPGEPGAEFPHGAIALSVEQVRALPHDARSYIWLHWFGNTLVVWLPFLAIALASAGMPPSGGVAAAGAIYTLSMPVSRRKMASGRIVLGILEMAVAALFSSLLVCAGAPLVGQTFSVRESLVHALLAIAGIVSFYGVLVFLSTTVGELHKAVLGAAMLFLYGMLTFLATGFRQFSMLRLMTGDMYFLRGEIPWAGICASVGVALVMVWLSLLIIERRDY